MLPKEHFSPRENYSVTILLPLQHIFFKHRRFANTILMKMVRATCAEKKEPRFEFLLYIYLINYNEIVITRQCSFSVINRNETNFDLIV